MNRIHFSSLLFFGFLILLWSCKPEVPPAAVYDGTPIHLDYGELPEPNLPEDNVLTDAGVMLGRMLFYEPMLSRDGSVTCATCHKQDMGMSDEKILSEGVDGNQTGRHSMASFNLAWHSNGFFWDGRAPMLRDQALMPIQDPNEMNETLANVVLKLRDSEDYTNQFIRAFGSDKITPQRIGLAIEQFMLSIVSKDSKYDRWLEGTAELTDAEERGRVLFFAEHNPFFPATSGADCAHCHSGKNFENDKFMNNGLDPDFDQTDIGFEGVTGLSSDKAKFKTPTLRNVMLTAPYMHDGRFASMEEVLDHYHNGIVESTTLAPELVPLLSGGLLLDATKKQDIIAFLHTLTDSSLATNPKYSSPF